MKYRPEIDGLRATAVTFVLLFHFFPSEIELGYLGVDLFFVISGYVITGQLRHQLTTSAFSFPKFYHNRIKRILPLSFFVIFITILFGYYILLTSHFEKLVDSAISASTFWSNIYFWRDGGYFGGSDKLKPLLHMWSLSVEEQFYIIFPIIVWVAYKKCSLNDWGVFFLLSVLSLCSLTLYLYLINVGGSNPAFFLMPTRAWQFGIGAMAVLVVQNRWISPNCLISSVSFCILLISFLIDFPYLKGELLTAISATFYIIYSSGRYRLDQTLSNSIFSYFGTRSFSIYLWHWPIVAYLNYSQVGEVSLEIKLAGILVCLVLSELSYSLIEKPYRYYLSINKTAILIALCSFASLGISFSKNLQDSNNLAERLAEQSQTNFRCELNELRPYGSSRACILKELTAQENVAILGNSHSQMYAEAIRSHYQESNTGIIVVPLNGCPPTLIINISSFCMSAASRNFEAVMADKRISTVFVGTTYHNERYILSDGTVVDEASKIPFVEGLINLVQRLQQEKDNVYLIGPFQIPGYDLPNDLARLLRFGDISETDIIARFSVDRSIFDLKYEKAVEILSDELGDSLLLPHEYLCTELKCSFADMNGSYFSDSNHLGQYGIDRIRTLFDELSD